MSQVSNDFRPDFEGWKRLKNSSGSCYLLNDSVELWSSFITHSPLTALLLCHSLRTAWQKWFSADSSISLRLSINCCLSFPSSCQKRQQRWGNTGFYERLCCAGASERQDRKEKKQFFLCLHSLQGSWYSQGLEFTGEYYSACENKMSLVRKQPWWSHSDVIRVSSAWDWGTGRVYSMYFIEAFEIRKEIRQLNG